MYRDAELRKYQYFVVADWAGASPLVSPTFPDASPQGGLYASPSMSGSRCVSWACLAALPADWRDAPVCILQPQARLAHRGHMGRHALHGRRVRPPPPLPRPPHLTRRSGYTASCRAIVTTARAIAAAIRTSIPELRVLGDPCASVVAFGSADERVVDALEVGDLMAKRGWHLNALSAPGAVHIACTVRLGLGFGCGLLFFLWGVGRVFANGALGGDLTAFRVSFGSVPWRAGVWVQLAASLPWSFSWGRASFLWC